MLEKNILNSAKTPQILFLNFGLICCLCILSLFVSSIDVSARIKSDDEVDLEEELKKAFEPHEEEYNQQKESEDSNDSRLEELEEELNREAEFNEPQIESEQQYYHNQAVIKVLNKITTRSETLKINIGSSRYFGNIEIFPIRCWKKESYYGNDTKLLVKILEHKLDSDPVELFHGWLFSHSPSINSLEHPVYYVTALDCKNKIY